MDARVDDVKAWLLVVDELDAVVKTLGVDEVRVLVRIAKRMQMGQGAYGRLHLATDMRNFSKEGREEIEDFMVYVACRWLKAEAGGGQ